MSTGELLTIQRPQSVSNEAVESAITEVRAAIVEVRMLTRARTRGLGGDSGCRR